MPGPQKKITHAPRASLTLLKLNQYASDAHLCQTDSSAIGMQHTSPDIDEKRQKYHGSHRENTYSLIRT